MNFLLILLSISLRCVIPSQNITSIAQDDRGNIWLSSAIGIGQLVTENGVASFSESEKNLACGYINRMYRLDENNLLICGMNGLYTYNVNKRYCACACERLVHLEINSVTFLPDAKLMASTMRGMYILEPVSSSTNPQYKVISVIHPTSDQVWHADFDSVKHIFLSTARGLELLGPPSQGYPVTMLARGKTRCFHLTESGKVFVSLGNSLFVGAINEFLSSGEQSLRLLHDNVDVVAIRLIDDELWIATRGQNVLVVNRKTEACSTIKLPGLSNSVLSIYQDRDSDIWIGTIDGLYVIEHDNSPFHYVNQSFNNLADDHVSDIYVDTLRNELWLATDGGLSHMTWKNDIPQIESFSDLRDPSNFLTLNRFQCVQPCANGMLLLSTKDNLLYFNPRTHQFQSIPQADQIFKQRDMHYVRCCSTDPAGNIFMAFHEGGIGVWMNATSTFVPIEWPNYNPDIHRAILYAPDGSLWVSSGSDGLYHLVLSPDLKQVVSAQLFPGERFNNRGITTLAMGGDSTLYIGTLMGLYTMNSSEPVISDYIASIDFDCEGNLWASSFNTLYCLSNRSPLSMHHVREFHMQQDNIKPWYIMGHASDGKYRMYLGGIAGLSYFDTQEVLALPRITRMDRKANPWIILMLVVLIVVALFSALYFAYRKIRQLTSVKDVLQKRVQTLASTPSELTELTEDEIFLKNALELVEKNISNEDFTVEQMATTMCMSPSGLYRRMMALTNLSPLEYIRSVRMKRASQLLTSGRYRVYEVCTMVGFSDQRYFSNCFRRQFGINPKAYSQQAKAKK